MEELAARVFVASCEKGDLAAVSSDDSIVEIVPFSGLSYFQNYSSCFVSFVLCVFFHLSDVILGEGYSQQ